MFLEAMLAYAAQHAAGNDSYGVPQNNNHAEYSLRCKKCKNFTHGCHGCDGPCGAFIPYDSDR